MRKIQIANLNHLFVEKFDIKSLDLMLHNYFCNYPVLIPFSPCLQLYYFLNEIYLVMHAFTDLYEYHKPFQLMKIRFDKKYFSEFWQKVISSNNTKTTFTGEAPSRVSEE